MTTQTKLVEWKCPWAKPEKWMKFPDVFNTSPGLFNLISEDARSAFLPDHFSIGGETYRAIDLTLVSHGDSMSARFEERKGLLTNLPALEVRPLAQEKQSLQFCSMVFDSKEQDLYEPELLALFSRRSIEVIAATAVVVYRAPPHGMLPVLDTDLGVVIKTAAKAFVPGGGAGGERPITYVFIPFPHWRVFCALVNTCKDAEVRHSQGAMTDIGLDKMEIKALVQACRLAPLKGSMLTHRQRGYALQMIAHSRATVAQGEKGLFNVVFPPLIGPWTCVEPVPASEELPADIRAMLIAAPNHAEAIKRKWPMLVYHTSRVGKVESVPIGRLSPMAASLFFMRRAPLTSYNMSTVTDAMKADVKKICMKMLFAINCIGDVYYPFPQLAEELVDAVLPWVRANTASGNFLLCNVTGGFWRRHLLTTPRYEEVKTLLARLTESEKDQTVFPALRVVWDNLVKKVDPALKRPVAAAAAAAAVPTPQPTAVAAKNSALLAAAAAEDVHTGSAAATVPMDIDEKRPQAATTAEKRKPVEHTDPEPPAKKARVEPPSANQCEDYPACDPLHPDHKQILESQSPQAHGQTPPSQQTQAHSEPAPAPAPAPAPMEVDPPVAPVFTTGPSPGQQALLEVKALREQVSALSSGLFSAIAGVVKTVDVNMGTMAGALDKLSNELKAHETHTAFSESGISTTLTALSVTVQKLSNRISDQAMQVSIDKDSGRVALSFKPSS